VVHQVNVVFAGVSAGFTGTLFGHPLDLIKVRLQARSEYKGTIDCLNKTFKHDGVRGMFRGISSPLFGLTVLNAITFGAYNKFNKMQETLLMKLRTDGFTQLPTLTFYNHFISGGGVGVLCSVFSCPFEVIKVRMQLDGRRVQRSEKNASPVHVYERKYSGFFDCGKKIWKAEGFRGYYSGYIPTIIRDVSFCATYFAAYEVMKKYLILQPIFNKPDPITNIVPFSPIPIIISGGLSGAIAWIVSFPLDVVKTTMQDVNKFENGNCGCTNTLNNFNNSTTTNLKSNSNNMFGVARSHYQRVGLAGFYCGLAPAIFRAFLVSSVRFLTFESVLHLLGDTKKS